MPVERKNRERNMRYKKRETDNLKYLATADDCVTEDFASYLIPLLI